MQKLSTEKIQTALRMNDSSPKNIYIYIHTLVCKIIQRQCMASDEIMRLLQVSTTNKKDFEKLKVCINSKFANKLVSSTACSAKVIYYIILFISQFWYLISYARMCIIMDNLFAMFLNLLLWKYVDLDSGRWTDWRRTVEGIVWDNIHTIFTVPAKESSERLLLPYHSCNGGSFYLQKHAFMWG